MPVTTPSSPSTLHGGPTKASRQHKEGTPVVDELLTPQQTADALCTSLRFVRRLIAERRIGYVKVGRFVRIPRSELERFVEAGRVEVRLPIRAPFGRVA